MVKETDISTALWLGKDFTFL